MTQVTSAQGYAGGERDGLPHVPSIPLADDRAIAAGDQSIGNLVKDATTHLSTLIRAEVELAKSEVTREVKKGFKGSGLLIAALVVLLYSSFFLFFALAEMLADFGLLRSLSFGVVFLLMLVLATFLGVLGWRKLRGVRAPQRTIDSVRDTASALAHRGADGRDPRR